MLHGWKLILENPLTRVRTYAKYQDDELICRDVMSADDANALADRTHEVRAELEHGNEWRHQLRRSTQANRTHVATIPCVVVNQLMREGIWGDAKAMERWLNSSENQCWRTGGGRLRIRET